MSSTVRSTAMTATLSQPFATGDPLPPMPLTPSGLGPPNLFSTATGSSPSPSTGPSPLPATPAKHILQPSAISPNDQPMSLSLGAQHESVQVELDSGSSLAAKGKRVDASVQLSEQERADKQEREQQAIVEKVLKRAELARITRNFRTRLALAAFKTSRGWQDVRFDVIEPHLEEEATKHRQAVEAQSAAQLANQQHYQQQQHHQQQHRYQQQELMYPVSAPPSGMKRPRGGSLATGASMLSSVGSNSALGGMYDQYLASDPSSSSSPYQGAYNSPYGPPLPYHHPHQPLASTSSLQAPAQMQTGNGNGAQMIGEAHRQKRRLTASEMGSPFIGQGPPPQQHRPPTALSTTDPNFSSFVDAASVLSGLSHHSHPSQAADPTLSRPHTPPGKGKGLASSQQSGGEAEGAAELMLFLAASPSPVQDRRRHVGEPTMGSEGGGLKGRRLFSGTGDDDGPFGAGGNPSSFSPRPPSSSSSGLENGFGGLQAAPSLMPASSQALPKAQRPYSASGLSHANGHGTNGVTGSGGGAWDSYLNVSPSPTRQAQSLPPPSNQQTSFGGGNSQQQQSFGMPLVSRQQGQGQQAW